MSTQRTDRPVSSIARLVEAIMGRRVAGPVDFLARYAGTVLSQSTDGATVDVRFDDTRLASPSAVEIRHGIPGATVKVQPGARVLVAWEGGDPTKPFVEAWEKGATVTSIVVSGATVYLGAESGAKFVGLHGDAVNAAGGMTTWMSQVAGFINAAVPGTVSPAAPVTFGTLVASATQTKAK